MASPTVTWKRGSTWAASVAYTPGAGDPSDLSTVTIACSVMDHNERRYVNVVTKHNDNMGFDIYFDGDSSSWADGTAAIDYKLMQNGIVFYSTTSRFIIEKQITL
jgi:hypothetical protein